MSDIIAVMGKSGNGKTRSIVGLDPASTYVIQVIRKRLPFKGGETNYFVSTPEKKRNRKIIFDSPISPAKYQENKLMFFKKYDELNAALVGISDNLPHIKTIVIDDSQYLMAYEFVARSKEAGYEKYNAIGANFMSLVTTAQSLREDMIVIFLHHSEEDANTIKLKTVGKMIDNYITLDGIFETLLVAESRKSNNGGIEYFFTTQSDGKTTAKSAEGMFNSEEPNDLGIIINKYRQYFNLKG